MSLKYFSSLIHSLSSNNNIEVAAGHLTDYFSKCPDGKDKDCALSLLLDEYPIKLIQSKQLASLTTEMTGHPAWLVERSQQEVGNPVKTLSLLIRTSTNVDPDSMSLTDLIHRIRGLSGLELSIIKSFLLEELSRLNSEERFLVLKLLTGTFRSPISERILILALSSHLQIDPRNLCLRLHNLRQSNALTFEALNLAVPDEQSLIPGDFPTMTELKEPAGSLGESSSWLAFGKKDGIPVQLIKYGQVTHLWHEHFDIISNKFPEVLRKASSLEKDVRLFGQIVPADPNDDIELLVRRVRKKRITTADVRKCEAELEVWQINHGKHGVTPPSAQV